MQDALINEDIHSYLDRHQKKELLRFLTCGSVDDGKSTLIGRLLHDTKGIYEDQLAAVKKDSAKHGTTGEGQIDLALLTDGLRAEREQGITIDVAYRYFSTDKRKFIIADTPGHEQYTRNMATGASTCQLAIILIDARHGVQVQTKRHSYICALLGIKHLVIAINKMDLVGYSQERFEEIRQAYLDFAKPLAKADGASAGGGVKNATFIPLSALNGDNVVTPSASMPWYTAGGGPTLLEHIETVSIAGDRNLTDFRMPVQMVLRPNLNFRGFAGTLASGVVKKGDAVRVLPSGKTSTVKSIVTYDSGEAGIPEAYAPMSIVLTLQEEIDISRGDMLVHAHAEPARPTPLVASQIDAMVVWMSEQPFVTGKSYWFKQTTRIITGTMVAITHAVDVNTLEQRPGTTLALNEVGRVLLNLASPLVFDPYAVNAATGGFIIVDRLSNNTVGAGMILGAGRGGLPTSSNRGRVTEDEKKVRLGQRGAVVWAGKSVADGIERSLFEEGRTLVRLDAADLQSITAAIPLIQAAVDQAIIILIASDHAPDASLTEALGKRLLIADSSSAETAIHHLRILGIAAAEESIAGDGI